MRRLVLVTASLLALAPLAHATWSIVLANPATGEVAVGTATCIGGDIENYVPVIRVGHGAGAVQSVIDNLYRGRTVIWDELPKGTDPLVIKQLFEAADPNFQARQYGIADLQGRSLTFSGNKDGIWAGGVSGTAGTIAYAIQGNVLTGQPVVLAAEQAILNTQGDLGQKLLAAMDAARSMGGDGRCSCHPLHPTQCGSPPPSFTKSAIIGAMVVARVGDTDGTCVAPTGCSTGQYYMDLDVTSQISGTSDPIPFLQSMYATWRATKAGRPDHVKSKNVLNRPVLHANGTDTTKLGVRLFDIDGVAIPVGGATVSVTVEPGATAGVTIGSVNDLGTGEYWIPISAQNTTGTAKLRVVVDDGMGPVTLYPFPTVTVAKAPSLTCDVNAISASAGGAANFTLDTGAVLGTRPYLVLCSLSGTAPGFWQGSVLVPLVHDFATDVSVVFANVAPFTSTLGVLDSAGAASASASFPAGVLSSIVGSQLSFAFVTLDDVDFASEAVTVAVGA